MQSQLIGHLRRTHGIRKILLVSEYQKDGITKLVFVQHSVHLITSSIDTVRIIGIHHENESLGILVIVSPERADLILTTDIPYSKGDVLVFDGLDIETDGGDGRYDCVEKYYR